MKRLLIIMSTIVFLSLFTDRAYAMVASSPTPAPTAVKNSVSEKLDQQINQLKEKIASRVSELNLVEKRGTIGIVTEVKGNQITLTDLSGLTRYADVDEITKFSSAGTSGFGVSDLKKGTSISILGIYNKQSKRILARFIKTYTAPKTYSGVIASTAPKQFQITITTAEKKDIVIDIATTTKLSAYAPDTDVVRYGFSKLAVGDRVIVVGSSDRTDPNLFSASRLLDLIGIPKDPNIIINAPVTPTSAATATPTKAGSKNLNPIR